MVVVCFKVEGCEEIEIGGVNECIEILEEDEYFYFFVVYVVWVYFVWVVEDFGVYYVVFDVVVVVVVGGIVEIMFFGFMWVVGRKFKFFDVY